MNNKLVVCFNTVPAMVSTKKFPCVFEGQRIMAIADEGTDLIALLNRYAKQLKIRHIERYVTVKTVSQDVMVSQMDWKGGGSYVKNPLWKRILYYLQIKI